MQIINCRDIRPRNVYWVMGLVRRRLVVREQGDVSEGVRISELWKDYDQKGLWRYFKEECLLGLSKTEVKRPNLSSRATLQTTLLKKINIGRG